MNLRFPEISFFISRGERKRVLSAIAKTKQIELFRLYTSFSTTITLHCIGLLSLAPPPPPPKKKPHNKNNIKVKPSNHRGSSINPSFINKNHRQYYYGCFASIALLSETDSHWPVGAQQIDQKPDQGSLNPPKMPVTRNLIPSPNHLDDNIRPQTSLWVSKMDSL